MMKMKWKAGLKIGGALLALAMLLLPALPVAAQAVTTLAVTPEVASIPLGNAVEVELTVTGGVRVNAFDVTLTYDPAILTLTKWKHGDYLKKLAVVKEVNEPGTLRVAATQLAQPGVSGAGALLVLRFETLSNGISPILIDAAAFADAQGVKTIPESIDGQVEITLQPTFTATPSPTQTPTTKPTLTPTLGAYPVATLAPKSDDPLVPVPGERTGEGEPVFAASPASGSQPTSTLTEDVENAGVGEVDQDPNPQSPAPTEESRLVAAGEARESDGGAGGLADSDGAQISAPSAGSAELLNILLWGVLILAMVALMMMFGTVLKRKNQKEEDLLL